MISSNTLWTPTLSSTKEHFGALKSKFNEESIIDFIAGLSPWLAPLPSAVFVQQAAASHLHSGESLAWIIAVVIETLGLTTTHTALAFHGWNKTHEKRNHAPFTLAVILAGVYIVATLGLIGVLKAFPEFSGYAPLLFPVLGVVGAVNLAMRGHHNQRVKAEFAIVSEERQRKYADEDTEKALKVEERRMKMQAKYGVTQAVTPSVTPTVDTVTNRTNVTFQVSESERIAEIEKRLNQGQKQQPTAWAREFGCSRQQIYRDIEKVVSK